MYYNGQGVQRDYAEAAKWVRKAAEQGYAPAQADLSYLDEFVFRFNRRRTRHAAFRSLLGIAAGHAPVTYQMLISPEASA